MKDKDIQLNAQSTDGWAFNLRTFDVSYASDDSDPEDSPQKDGISEETKLIQDLDLSSREEAVVFKPNPFNIAKINAASRSAPRFAGTALTEVPRRDKSKTNVKRHSGSILDGFKRQAQRALHLSSTDIAVPLKPSSNTKRLVPGPLSKTTTNTKAGGTRKSPNIPINQPFRPPAPVSKPTSGGAQLQTLVRSTVSDSTDVELVSGDNLPSPSEPLGYSTQPELGILEGPHILRPNASIPQVLPSIQVAKIRPRPRHQPYPFSSPIHPRSPNRPFSFSSPIQPQPRPQTWSRELPLHGGSTARRSDVTFLSSPIRSSQDNAATPISQHPVMSKTHKSFSAAPTSFLSPPFAYGAPTGALAPPTTRTIMNDYQGINENYPPPSPEYDHVFPDYSLAQHGPSVYDPQPHQPPIRQPRDRVYATKNEPYSPYNQPNTPYPEGVDDRPHIADHAHLRRKRSPSPRMNPRTPPKQRTDAYTFMDPNSDEEWSTLPARKKRKSTDVKATNSVKTSGKFRLPNTLLPPQVNKTGMSATSTRRVITFMPPPLAKVRHNEEERALNNGTPARRQVHTATPEEKMRLERRNSPTVQPYPSPKFSSPVIHQPQSSPSPPHRLESHQRIPVYRPLSPPTSDPPVPVSFDTDGQTVSVDLESIKANYPGVKARSRR